MQIDATKYEGALILRVDASRIDAAVAIEFKESVRLAAEAPGNPLVLDLSSVTFLDSSGLGAVVAIMKLLAPERRLELAGLTPNVAKVFRLTRMDTMFTIHDAAPGALRAAG
ncbi:MAG: STAS domain-containing protein [Paracoccaceae bacterium]